MDGASFISCSCNNVFFVQLKIVRVYKMSVIPTMDLINPTVN